MISDAVVNDLRRALERFPQRAQEGLGADGSGSIVDKLSSIDVELTSQTVQLTRIADVLEAWAKHNGVDL